MQLGRERRLVRYLLVVIACALAGGIGSYVALGALASDWRGDRLELAPLEKAEVSPDAGAVRKSRRRKARARKARGKSRSRPATKTTVRPTHE